MFIEVTQLQHQQSVGREHVWRVGDDGATPCLLAGAVLGTEVLRVRLLRGQHFENVRYQLASGEKGTLPYHSWMVAKGDESWPQFGDGKQAIATLEPYLHGFSYTSTALSLSRRLATEERIFGLGERTGSMDKRGQAFPIWNVDPPQHHTAETVTMYASIPFYIGYQLSSGRCYGVLVDSVGLVEMDMGRTNEAFASMTVQGDSLVVYFLVGPTPADVMRQYTELTGHMPMPPRWSIGYQQCRWGYRTQERVAEVATKIRANHHPCDAIWLDIDYMNGYRNFTWDPERYPDPKKMTQDLHTQGLHMVTILDPGTKIDENYFVYQEGLKNDAFCRYQNGELFQGNVWPGACVFPDYSQSHVREWWGNLYHILLDAGVDGIWNDMNEPSMTNMMVQEEAPVHGTTMSLEVLHRAGGDDPTGPDGPPVLHEFFHNAYGMEMARSTHEGLLRLRPDTRPFVLTRSGTAGTQRYAAIWTGDNDSKWEHIQMAIPMCLNLGMSGIPFIGADIGGFWDKSDGELLVRFAQLGAFFPFCRNHNSLENPDQEPWAFGEPYESAYRQAIETRYRFLPYLYTLFREANLSGAPIMRPLYYHFPQEAEALDVETEFLVGEVLLSAPISEQGATKRNVYLPPGLWYSYWDNQEYPGGGWTEIEAPLERWPLLVRDNSILVTGPLMQYTGEKPTDPLTIACYMATDGLASYTLYEDDGSSLAYQNGTYAETTITCRVTGDTTVVEIEEFFANYRPTRNQYDIVVHVGSRTLTEHARAGQGKITLHLQG
ncbi:MAG TPA: TIM-barrel domain-containing protein [Ktedonobacteraceae bacterium]|nr:TIM-barrel domain-containing protein [Ktedonobacteraceae bacterium]